MPECITKGEPKLEAAPPASHGMAQPKCSDCSRMDPLPLESGRSVRPDMILRRENLRRK